MRSPREEALQYGWPEGSFELRRWVAGRLRARGARVDESDIIITAGAQQALSITAEILLADLEGACVAVDAETYPVALDVIRARGAEPTHDLGASAFAYVMPAITNPRGNTATEPRREALLAWKGTLVEDDAYAELRFDGIVPRPLLADAPDRVFHLGTVSKTLCPGTRGGAPRALRLRRAPSPRPVYLRIARRRSRFGIATRAFGPSLPRARWWILGLRRDG